jgi:integrase
MALKKTSTGYQVQWYDASGHFRKRTIRGVDKESARRIERELLAARDRGEGYVDPRRAPTFTDAAAAWQAATEVRRKASTRTQVAGMLTTHLLPRWGDRRVSTLIEQDALALQSDLQDVTKLSPGRSNNILFTAKAILGYCVRRRWISVDPFDGVRALDRPSADVDPLSQEEIAAFLDSCPGWWRPWFVTAFYTGARPSELAALAWGDVSEATGTFRIRAGLRQRVLSTPKTLSSTRDVPMLPPVVTAIQQQRKQIAALRLKGGVLPERDHVFLTPLGRPVESSALRRAVWLPTLRKARLRVREMYQTRHSFASNALSAGEDPLWISRVMGHANPRLLFSTYARWISSPTRRDGSALLAHLGGHLGGGGEQPLPKGRVSGEERSG